MQSYGRRKREAEGEDVLLANAIHILEKFTFSEEQEQQEQQKEQEEVQCRGELLPVSVVAAVFLLIQVSPLTPTLRAME